jgi:hypothetical protein
VASSWPPSIKHLHTSRQNTRIKGVQKRMVEFARINGQRYVSSDLSAASKSMTYIFIVKESIPKRH